MGNFLVSYASGVVIYDLRAVLRLATDVFLKRDPITAKRGQKVAISVFTEGVMIL